MTDIPSAELLERYRQHDAAAAEELFRRYAERLTRLARSRLARQLAGRLDAEDVVLSAYRSFFLRARTGAVVLEHSGDLWRLLVRITLRKVYRSARRHRAECRNVEREVPWPADRDASLEAAALPREPTPAEAATLADELRCVLAPLPPIQRQIIERRLQGYEIEEIAVLTRRSPRTVRRTLAALVETLQQRLRDETPPVTKRVGQALLSYGDFLLRQQLGQGGMGKVYRALWRSTASEVAVKLIHKPLRQHQPAIARFLQEADLLARLRHPGIVTVHGLGLLPDGGYFLVMDLIAGTDLARRLSAGPVSLPQALCWVAQAADAIDHAHQQDIIHCDLKPSNLLLDPAGHIHLSDFGLARNLAVAEPLCPGGTPGFLAPEQIDPSRGPISPRTDIHGLGAVLYTLLTGQPPFPADGQGGSSERFVSTEQLPDPSRWVEIPSEVAALCQRCLAPDPQQRFASAGELALALRDLERSLGSPGTTGG